MNTHGMSKHDKWLVEESERREIQRKKDLLEAARQQREWIEELYEMAEAAYAWHDAKHREEFNGHGIPGDADTWIEGWIAGWNSRSGPTA